jgi:hypothetical protein
MAFAMGACLLFASFPSTLTPTTLAADHRDASIVDARPEGDFPDVFAHISPNDPGKLVLSLNTNPFANPAELASYRMAADYLYQIKIDNNGDAVEDYVIQFTFDDSAQQIYEVRAGVPNNPHSPKLTPVMDTLLNVEPICRAITYHGGVNGDNAAGAANQPPSEGPVGASPTPTATPTPTPNPGGGREPVLGRNDTRCFVGVRDDPFVTDVGQAVFRIGLNPNPRRNFNNHEQEIFRQNVEVLPTSPFGPVRGRPMDQLDQNSGLDGFGGYNASVLAVEIPKEWVRGTGLRAMGPAVPDSLDSDGDGNTTELLAANTIAAVPGGIGVWATASIAKSDNGNERVVAKLGEQGNVSTNYQQFERMGQQLFNTVWVWRQQPANAPNNFPGQTDREIKNFFNQLAPEHDVENFAYLIPDALVVTADQAAENSVQGRRAVLTSGGFTTPETGMAYLLDQLPAPFNAIRSANVDKRLLERILLPDYLRLDIDRPSSVIPALPGAQASNNGGNDLGLIQFGLQNGRRTADDVTDTVLRFARELTDVCYTPAGEAIPGRRCLRCVSAVFPQAPPGICSDSRVTAVLQGTDWIEPDAMPDLLDPLGALNNLANSGNDRQLNTEFPFFASQHPQPGETGEDTTGYPRASDPAIVVLGGRANDNQINR